MNELITGITKYPEVYKSIAKGALGKIPIVGGVVVEVWNCIDASLLERRIKELENAVKKQKSIIFLLCIDVVKTWLCFFTMNGKIVENGSILSERIQL